MSETYEEIVDRKVPWKLYGSRLISSWGDRMWSFAVGLFMIELSPGSLKWPAVYGLALSLSVVFCGPAIGRWVDRNQRWRAARISLTVLNSSVALCALCVTLIFYFRTQLEDKGNDWGPPLACLVILILGSFAKLASLASSIVINKDWIFILADGDQEHLARMNSACRTIDLATNIIAPTAVGQMMYFLSHTVTAMVIVAWNVVTFVIEITLLWLIYRENPKLSVKQMESTKKDVLLQDNHRNDCDGTGAQLRTSSDDNSKRDVTCCQSFAQRFGGASKSWSIYFNHQIRNAGIGLACLYMTVLGFDAITTSFAYSQGVPEHVLGTMGGLGSGVGLLGSIFFPFLVCRLGVLRTGMCGFGLEVLCLTLCVASVWAPGSPFDAGAVFNSTIYDPFIDRNSTEIHADEVDYTHPFASIVLLLAGITAARFGLWIADLSVNQILQGVEDGIRGTVNAVQISMNMIFDTCKFVLVIIFPLPETFGILVCISFVAIVFGWMLYASYYCQQISRHRDDRRQHQHRATST